MNRLALLFAVLVAFMGCQSPTGSSNQTPASNADPIVGTWTLKSFVNGKQLSQNVDETTQTGSLTATVTTFSWTLVSGGSSTTSGTWTKSAAGYTLTTTKAVVWTATISSGLLTVVNGETVDTDAYKSFTYTK
jgi:hypothetical protein